MKLPDGREAVCRLATPLPIDLAARVMRAVSQALQEAGYTAAVILTAEGPHNGLIAAYPPGHDTSGYAVPDGT